MNVPRNVQWFEFLLYLSLMLDTLSAAFQERQVTAEVTEQTIAVAMVVAVAVLLLLVNFVWLAAQRRKNWPRWVLLAVLVLSSISLARMIGENGVGIDNGVDVVSSAIAAAGLYFSFTGDARDWFNS